MLKDFSLEQFISELASKSPAPGGGSTAALSSALGCALTSMVCNLTIGKKKYADVSEELTLILKRCEQYQAHLTSFIDKDTEAFNKIMSAFAMPRESDEEKIKRSEAIQEATLGAIDVPLEVMSASFEVLKLTKVVAEKGNQNSISDAGCAALQLLAGAKGAMYNAQINLMGLNDAEMKTELKTRAEALIKEVEVMAGEICEMVERAITS